MGRILLGENMANEEKLGKHDVLVKRIEGKTVNGEPAFAMAIFDTSSSVESVDTATNAVVSLRLAALSNVSFQSDAQYTPMGYVGVYVLLDVETQPASGTLALFIDIYNPVSASYSAVWQSAYMPATGTATSARTFLVRPDVVDDANLLYSVGRIPIPAQWRMRCLHGGGSGTWTYALAYQYVG